MPGVAGLPADPPSPAPLDAAATGAAATGVVGVAVRRPMRACSRRAVSGPRQPRRSASRRALGGRVLDGLVRPWVGQGGVDRARLRVVRRHRIRPRIAAHRLPPQEGELCRLAHQSCQPDEAWPSLPCVIRSMLFSLRLAATSVSRSHVVIPRCAVDTHPFQATPVALRAGRVRQPQSRLTWTSA